MTAPREKTVFQAISKDKLFPKTCYFNPSVLTRRIKVDLQGKMLLVCLSASQTLLFLEDSSEQVPPTAKEPNSALWAAVGATLGEHRGKSNPQSPLW